MLKLVMLLMQRFRFRMKRPVEETHPIGYQLAQTIMNEDYEAKNN